MERTDGAKFESKLQKSLYSHYVTQAICIEDGDLDDIRRVARERRIAIYLGIVERAADRGGHSLDVVGHYSRPDVTHLVVNRKRQTTAEFSD